MNEKNNNRLLKIQDLGDYLGISPSTIREYLRRGHWKIPHFRIGRAIRFKHEDVMKFIEMHQAGPSFNEATRAQELMIETNNRMIEELAASKKKPA